MIKRITVFVVLCWSVSFAALSPSSVSASDPPSEASIKQLLEVAQARKLVDTIMSQMDAMMKKVMQQATQGRPISPQVQRTFDKCRSDVTTLMKEEFSWDKMEPMYIRIYQKSFSQEEVDGMIAFYKTPTGQALLNKMPLVMQNTMNEVQSMMGPMMQRIQRMQQDVIAQIQAEKDKTGG